METTNNIIKEIRQNLSSGILRKEPVIADYITDNQGEKKYKFLISEVKIPIIKEKPERKAPKDLIELARNTWYECKKNNTYQSLIENRRIVRILCGEPDIVKDLYFINFMGSYNTNITPKMIRLLVQSYHSLYSEKTIDSVVKLERILTEHITNYKGRKKSLLTWKNNLSAVVGIQATKLLATECLQKNIKISDLVNTYSLFSENTAFIDSILDNLLKDYINIISQHYQPNTLVDYIFTEILKHNLVYNNHNKLSLFLSKLIILTQNFNNDKRNILKSCIKDYLLTHTDYKDPRLNTGKWNYIDSKAREIFTSWLAEEDIEFFFELLIKNDPHKRKPFWLQYLKDVKRSVVIVNHSIIDYEQNKKLYDLRKKGRTFASGIGINTHSFILDFGTYLVVEFSKSGNAAYFYQLEQFLKLNNAFFKKQYDLRSLKDPDLKFAIYKQIHSGNWQLKLKQKLSEYGIRASSYGRY